MKRKFRKQPEPIETAKARARVILAKEPSRFALYFPNIKLAGVSIYSHRYESVMADFPCSVIGVYEPSCPFHLIEDDIEAYYAEYAAMVEAKTAIDKAKTHKDIDVPIFRSSGRRNRKVA